MGGGRYNMCRTFHVARSSLFILSDTVQFHEENIEIRPCVSLVFVYKRLKTWKIIKQLVPQSGPSHL